MRDAPINSREHEEYKGAGEGRKGKWEEIGEETKKKDLSTGCCDGHDETIRIGSREDRDDD
jgi:hypothetical protein